MGTRERGVGTRALALVVAALLLLGYLGASALAYWGLATLWAYRPDPWVVLVGVLVFALAFGYLSHRVGAARLLSRIDARPLDPRRAPTLYERVEEIADRMDLPAPALAVTRLHKPNAFALAGGDGVVVVDASLFEVLDREELLAVLAHELAHLESHDSFRQAVAYSAIGVVVGAVGLLALPATLALKGVALAAALLRGRPPSETIAGRLLISVGAALSLAVVGGTLLLRADARRREFVADERAAEATGNPLALASALRKIERHAEGPWETPSPLYVRGDEEGKLARMLDTHPDTEERVERLVRKAE